MENTYAYREGEALMKAIIVVVDMNKTKWKRKHLLLGMYDVLSAEFHRNYKR